MSNQPQVTLAPLEPDDKEQFILDNQWAFKYGATEEFGVRDDHFEEDGEIISRHTIEQSINNGKAYRILLDGEKVGGVVVSIDKAFLRGELELLFVKPDVTAKALAMRPGVLSKRCILKLLFGRLSRPISRSATSTSMSTNAVSTSWSLCGKTMKCLGSKK